jgi:hypothetical protein
MDIQKPKPWRGLPEFLKEIGTIVVGVLIALGAEQAVEVLRWNHEVGEFRRALDAEVAQNLAFYDYRIRQSDCLGRRVAELRRWRLERAKGHSATFAREIGRPSVQTFSTNGWDARSADLVLHMPLNVRLEYSSLYGVFAYNERQLEDERDTWRSLAAFNGMAKLSEGDASRLNELIYRVSSLDQTLQANARWANASAARLGVKPRLGSLALAITPPDPEFCKSLFIDVR